MKKGFTLIELLAVIVILAIIALIAVPIIINIIDNSKKSSSLRSAEFYLDAVEVSIANRVMEKGKITDGTYPITQEGNICLGVLTQNTCSSDVLKVKVNGESAKSGTITIIDGEVSYADMSLGNERLIQNSEGVVTNFPCKKVSGDKNTRGSKYECEVKEGVKYNFYVTSQEDDGTTNLILDRNICSDGSLTDPSKSSKCLVIWNSTGVNSDGPIVAMNYLHNATKDWLNIPTLDYIYNDREIHKGNSGYISFVSENGIATITPFSGEIKKIGTEKEPLRARMPIFVTGGTKNDVTSAKATTEYLYDYLSNSGSNWRGTTSQPTNNINSINGYWTISTYDSTNVFNVHYYGFINNSAVGTSYSGYGVRPVINIKL